MIYDANAPMPMKDEKYLAWVRSLPSALSGKKPCVAHHRIGHGRLGNEKESDYQAMPLTDAEHKQLHDIGWSAWESLHCVDQRVMVMKTLMEAIRLGVLKPNGKAMIALVDCQPA